MDEAKELRWIGGPGGQTVKGNVYLVPDVQLANFREQSQELQDALWAVVATCARQLELFEVVQTLVRIAPVAWSKANLPQVQSPQRGKLGE